MANIIIPEKPGILDTVEMMGKDARYEVGYDGDAERTAAECAINIKSKKSPPKIPKIFMSNNCVFNCAYCGCRCSREDKGTYLYEPEELARIAFSEAKFNTHGIFITSAIYKNADYTQERLAECSRILREDYRYRGFLHTKVMPGADPELINKTGRYADRLSINIEVADSGGYGKIAKQKNKTNILTPMKNISDQITQARYERQKFAVSQTTQLMAGSTGEDDRTILRLASALYGKYGLKRVYYTAFHYTHEAKGYEDQDLSYVQTPYWRMARLYQADRLLELYGFKPEEIADENCPNLEQDIDPKAAWALRHLDLYPVEVNTADYETLLRIPGIGITYAKRIIEARKFCRLTYNTLESMKVSLKRSRYFMTCSGKYYGGNVLFSANLRDFVISGDNRISITSALEEGICE